ncbi:MAG: GntR family transcriptional regulator [Proteobacteria bacterium]|nr:GntR family transcriptional regulator [Pseudomonadota bacterium]
MKYSIDRALPVALGAQLRGLIEYGIACGELVADQRLPSVREMAEATSLAPMTVSQVYRELQASGLIETRPGHGTFVAAVVPAYAMPPGALAGIQSRFRELIDEAVTLGMSHADVTGLVHACLNRRAQQSSRLRLALVGIFADATRAYAAAIRERLQAGDGIEAITLDQLKGDAKALKRLQAADLVLTFANRKAEVAQLLGRRRRVVAMHFIPSEATRLALARLDPRTRLAVVSLIPEFLAIMKSGVERFAPHLAGVHGTLLAADELASLLARVDVVVYSTGAEAVLDLLPERVRAFEYRHTPDPNEIDQVLLPMLAQIRSTEPSLDAPGLAKEAS